MHTNKQRKRLISSLCRRGGGRCVARNLERAIKTGAEQSEFQTGENKDEIDEDQRKKVFLKFGPLFCPDLGEDKKKEGPHSDSVRFSALIFCTNSKRGGMANFAYFSEVIIL